MRLSKLPIKAETGVYFVRFRKRDGSKNDRVVNVHLVETAERFYLLNVKNNFDADPLIKELVKDYWEGFVDISSGKSFHEKSTETFEISDRFGDGLEHEQKAIVKWIKNWIVRDHTGVTDILKKCPKTLIPEKVPVIAETSPDFVMTVGGIDPLPLRFGYDVQRNKTPTLWLVNKSVEEEVSAYDMIKRIADSVDQTPINLCLPRKCVGKYETIGYEVLGAFYVSKHEINGERLNLLLWEWAVKTAEVYTLKKKLENATSSKNEWQLSHSMLNRVHCNQVNEISELKEKLQEYVEANKDLMDENTKMRENCLEYVDELCEMREEKKILETTNKELGTKYHELRNKLEGIISWLDEGVENG